MDATARFSLPFILPGQAQKELFHNEALILLDTLLHAAVEEMLASPPAAPQLGQHWIVGAEPSGAWSGKTGQVAGWTEGGWRFVQPQIGMGVWDKAAGVHRRWTGSQWTAGEVPASSFWVNGQQVVGSRAGAIASPSGGTTIDTEARAAVGAVIVALRQHGLID